MPTPRWIRREFPDQGGEGATKKKVLATALDTARLSIPGWRRHDFPDQGGVVQFFRPRRKRRDLPDRGGNSATKTKFLATAMDTARHSIPGCRRHHFPDRGGDDATFHTRVQTASFSRTWPRRPDQENVPCDRGGYGATLAIRVDMAHTKVDTAQLSRPRRRRRNQESNSRDQGGDAASFQTKAEMARLFRTGRRGRYFPDQRGVGATFQTKTDMARLFRTGRRGRYFPDQRGDGATKKNFPATAVDTARPFIPGWRRPDFLDQDRVGAFFQTKREMPQFSRPRQIRRDQESILAPAVDTVLLSKPGCRRPDFPDQDRVGAFFQTKREMPQFSRPRQIRRDQESILAPAVDTFHTRVETASLSRTRRRRRDQENIPGDRRGYGAILHTRVETA